MQRISCIIKNGEFMDHMARNEKLEEARVFCHHDMQHLLDVCRVAYILNLEKKYEIPKEIIYAAGLLHDIGRWKEYETGQDHALVSGKLALSILKACGFDQIEQEQIAFAISGHRQKGQTDPLGAILYEADKVSRPCYHCDVRDQCKRFLKDESEYRNYLV